MKILPMDDKVRRRLEAARLTDAYWIEALQIDLTHSLIDAMERAELSRADLARRLGCSRPYVTKMLKGDVNFTVETLVKLARALGCAVEVPRMVPGAEPVTVSARARPAEPAARSWSNTFARVPSRGWSGEWDWTALNCGLAGKFHGGGDELQQKPAAA